MTNIFLIIIGVVVAALVILFGLFGLVSAHTGGNTQPVLQISTSSQ